MRNFFGCLVLLGCANQPTKPAAPSGELFCANITDSRTTEGDSTVSDFYGTPIIVRTRPGAELVTFELVIRGGVTATAPMDTGLERLALFTAAGGGTEGMPKANFQKRLAELGISLEARSEPDGSMLEMKAPTERWPEAVHLLGQVFLRPALPDSEVELQRQQQLQLLHHMEENPDLQLVDLGRRTLFEGTAYASRTLGTEQSVAGFTPADVRRQMEALKQRSFFLVVVGNVDADSVFADLWQNFFPRGAGKMNPVTRPRFEAPRVTAIQRALPTNYILAQVLAPSWKDPDFVTGLVAMRILSGRQFEAIRTKRNLTYAVAARLNREQSLPVANLYVTAVDPPTTWKAMLDELRRFQEEPVEPERLLGGIAESRTAWLMAAESTDGEARQMVQAELLGGDWRLQRTIPDRMQQVTAAQVQAFARTWLHGWQVAVVGDPAKVDVGLFR